MATISEIADVKKLLLRKKVKIYGVGGSPSTRSEVWPFFESGNFEVVCANKFGELDSICQRVKVRYFTKRKAPVPLAIRKPAVLLKDKAVKDYIKKEAKKRKIGIYIYKSTKEIDDICRKEKWTLIGNKESVYRKVIKREYFYHLLEKIKRKREVLISKIDDLEKNINEAFDKFGNKIVAQLILDKEEGGGRSTIFFFKKNKKNIYQIINKRLKDIKYEGAQPLVVISRFHKGPNMSISGCITAENGVLTSNAQYQLIDIKEVSAAKNNATGVFCGHDWSLSSNISEKINKEAEAIAVEIGNLLKKEGVRGIFGVDFIWDEKIEEVVPLEINVRLLGTFPTSVYVQLEKKEVPLAAFHILEFLGIKYRIKNKAVYKKNKHRQGAHISLFNPKNFAVICEKEIKGGVYSLKRGRLNFERLGVELRDIKQNNEFIITDSVPVSGIAFGGGNKLLKIITKQAIAKNNGKSLNIWAKKIIKLTYKELKIKPYEKK